jgi:hypothetical protein
MTQDAMERRSEYDRALRALREAGAGKTTGLEQRYGLAYQRMVIHGEAQQIRRKYRG